MIAFEPKKRTKDYEIFVLRDNVVEPREFFILKLEMLAVGNVKKNHQTTIHISVRFLLFNNIDEYVSKLVKRRKELMIFVIGEEIGKIPKLLFATVSGWTTTWK